MHNLTINHADLVKDIYQSVLGREADASGLDTYVSALENGLSLRDFLSSVLSSEEFQQKHLVLTGRDFLPDLTKMLPHKYMRKTDNFSIFKAETEEDFHLMERLIAEYRFYDSNDVYSPKIDLDKRVTAAIIKGLGAQSCLEMGCFTGPVLSLLADQGVDVCGVDVSHLAFILAYRNIREKMMYGDIRALQFDRKFDVFYAMDVLEHLNSVVLDSYLSCIANLINPDGFIYINSPMFGDDDIFGTAIDLYIPEWKEEGDSSYFHHLHCDGNGWPVHGHTVLATPTWWENKFAQHGLVRDRQVERAVHTILGPFFRDIAYGRRSLFVLRRPSFQPDAAKIEQSLRQTIGAVLPDIG